ncbi:zinc-binding dehydrogenase [Micromonospora sp. WMMA1998]|uniref:Gfo/Idh/MocA family oxidoreductase n=1 Tax=Micromonospora sp. WMMA1998 TaxID=3015167 RepID=UPI00248B7E9C|nr:zinc-binding dehydrogenase [Micromonospora sp. WMMA1998]WBC16145.1 zinc-binding dehydrogenase [Micromonospora sp. WMMA1998]
MKPTGVGIIGPGAWASISHIPVIAASPAFELRAVSTSRRSSAEAAAARYGVPGYDDHRRLLADPQVDVVVVAVQVTQHFELISAALEVVPAPAGASHAEAATLPTNGLTASHALDQLRLSPDSTVAVTGAAGAVGGYAVQLAKAAGHRVLADAARQDADLVASLGADHIVDRGPGVADRFRALTADGVDAVVDAAVIGAPLLSAIRRGGTLAYVRGGPDQAAFERAAATRGVTLVYAYVHDYDGRLDKLDLLRRLADEGRLSLRVADTFPPQHAAQAHRLLAAGGVRGRLVIEW